MGVLCVSNSSQLAVIVIYPILETTFDYFCEIFLKKLIVLLLVSSATMFASAANWVFISSTFDKKTYSYVDTESISTQGIYKQAFSKIVTSEGYYFIALNSYDCKSNPKRVKNTYLAGYNSDGSVKASGSTNNSFNPVLPETIAKTETDFVCSF